MKERKTKQLRVRLTETQLKKLVGYIIDHPNQFKNQSDLIRESINEKICREERNKQKKSTTSQKLTTK